MLSLGRVAHRIQPSTGNQGRFVLQGYLGWRRLETMWLPPPCPLLTQTLEQAPIQSEHEASRPVLRSANDSDVPVWMSLPVWMSFSGRLPDLPRARKESMLRARPATFLNSEPNDEWPAVL